MAMIFDSIDEKLKAWIAAQPMWFVATAPLSADGHVNMSPRGLDSFSVLDDHRVGWIDYTGERDLLRLQAEKKGVQGMSDYRVERNSRSIDGLPGLPL